MPKCSSVRYASASIVISSYVIVLVRDTVAEEDAKLAFQQEVAIMWAFAKNEYFVKLLGYSENPMVIVMRYYQEGALQTLIYRDRKLTWDARLVLGFAIDIIAGINAMHEQGIVHNDIKVSSNVLCVL